jgi:ABC-type Fe3+-hydroxamate transport system substrate-binding protein
MEPMGEVGFSSVPETFVGRFGFVVDIVAALDELDSLVAMYSNYSVFEHSHFYDELETVSIDPTEIEELQTDDWDIRLERLYELAPDFTAIDPNYLIHYTQFDEDEVDQFINRVGPCLHNESQSERPDGWPTWPDGDYPYLTLAEFTRIYGEAFQKASRAEGVLQLNAEVRETVTDRLPPESERPTVAVGSLHDGTWHLDTFADAPENTTERCTIGSSALEMSSPNTAVVACKPRWS